MEAAPGNKVAVREPAEPAGTQLITLDPKTEKVTEVADGGDKAKANAMLFREYRKGFDISEAV